jgi:predicted nucleic acid-binding protein
MVLVDTNVLIDVVQDDPKWGDWSLQQLASQSQVHRLAINPVIYAELSMSYSTAEALDRVIDRMQLAFIEVPRAALFLAGRAFLRYRRRSGSKANVLADFFIGAHAAVSGAGLLTRDRRRYAEYFPTVTLITPDSLQ